MLLIQCDNTIYPLRLVQRFIKLRQGYRHAGQYSIGIPDSRLHIMSSRHTALRQ